MVVDRPSECGTLRGARDSTETLCAKEWRVDDENFGGSTSRVRQGVWSSMIRCSYLIDEALFEEAFRYPTYSPRSFFSFWGAEFSL